MRLPHRTPRHCLHNFNPRTPCGVRPGDCRPCYIRVNFNPRTPCGVRPSFPSSIFNISPFQSTHPLRGATAAVPLYHPTAMISIHAPLAGCDRECASCGRALCDFNPRTPCGVRRHQTAQGGRQVDFNPRTPCGVRPPAKRAIVFALRFQSTHPLRGATPVPPMAGNGLWISIHAPLAGCDRKKKERERSQTHFNPRTPCGVRRRSTATTRTTTAFQSTHPLRGATNVEFLSPREDGISIHAPLAGCDGQMRPDPARIGISIHAPLAGCDTARLENGMTEGISIHAPLAGCDEFQLCRYACVHNFNPRTPCGVRPLRVSVEQPLRVFQSTHPLRGATQWEMPNEANWNISIHAPLAGCDKGNHPYTAHYQDFNPRTPCGVRLHPADDGA